MIMVNGNTWPFQTVEQRRYRFRFLNGCQSRFLILDFSNIPGVEVWQIGNEGGFLAAPVNLTADNGNRLLMGLAERADVIVDFTNVPVGNYVLGNVGPDEPFGGGVPGRRLRRRPTRTPPARSCSSASFRRSRPIRRRRRSSCMLPAIAPLPAPVTHTAAGAHRDDVRCSATGRRRPCWAPSDADGMPDAQDVVDAGHREPERRRHRGLGVLQLHRRRAPDARPRGRLRGGEPAGAGHERRTARPSRRRDSSATRGRRRPGRRASRTRSSPIRARSPASRRSSTRPASSSGTATSSSTRTTR